jgi:anti-sigma B factor antagonist
MLPRPAPDGQGLKSLPVGRRFHPGPFVLARVGHTGGTIALMTRDYTLQPEGEIDVATVGPLREQWLATIAEHQPDTVIFDLSEVTFLDSMGLGLILGVHRRQRLRGGSVAIINASPIIVKMLHITGLHLVMDVQGTEDKGS